MIRKAIIVVLTLAAVGIGLAWLGSQIVYPWYDWTFQLNEEGRLNVWCVPGSASFGIWEPVENPVGDWSSRYGWGETRRGPPGWNNFSLEWGEYTSGRYWIVRCAYWLPFTLFAAYPTIAFIRGPLRRWRRRRKGLCLRCGYGLTGLPEPRCPECGTEFEG